MVSQILALQSVPDFTTLCHFLRRVNEGALAQSVEVTLRRLQGVGPEDRKRA